MRRKRPNIPAKLHQDDREIVGFLTTLLDYQKALVPTGCAVRNFATTVPDGFLSCDGSAFSSATYPDLYAAIGSATLPVLAGYVVKT